MKPEEIKPLKLDQFIVAVQHMRHYQKAYFAAPYGSQEKLDHLHKSKEWESHVDRLLIEVQNPQQSLF